MKMTLRSFTWEYGPLALLAVSLPVNLVLLVIPVTTATACFTAVFMPLCFGYTFYWWRVNSRYPTRGDLPEFKALAIEQRQLELTRRVLQSLRSFE